MINNSYKLVSNCKIFIHADVKWKKNYRLITDQENYVITISFG